MFPDRKSKALAIALGCAIAIFVLVPLHYVGDLARFQEPSAARQTQAALRDLRDPAQLDQLVGQYPSNGMLKLAALASRDWSEIDAGASGLLREVDPGELSKRINQGLSGRGDVEALGRDLKAAEDNSAALPSRYAGLVKAVRDRIEQEAGALETRTDHVAAFMAMIDAQHADMTALVAKLSTARVDYFKAYEKCAALLRRDVGSRGADGQFVFRLQSDADRYNEAAAATAVGAKRLVELEAERTALRAVQLERWKHWAGG